MAILNQKTINQSLNFEGITLHKGKIAKLKILPASPNTGIIFKRTDLNKNNLIPANFFNVSDATLCTTLTNEFGISVSTVEHLMAAFYGLGVDNALIEIDQDEIPIMDGSSKKFVEAIKEIGLKNSSTPIKIIKINREIIVKEKEKFILIDKSNVSSDIDFEIQYSNNVIANQRKKINVFEDNLEDVFNSRTFCLFEDIAKLKKLNLGKGGSLDNAIVIKDEKILNEVGLRNKLEFVNHKILDCMGDLYLSGYKIIGSLKCSQGGHRLTNQLLKKIFENKSNYSLIEIKGKQLPHNFANYLKLKSIA